jgi:hypothetical protein
MKDQTPEAMAGLLNNERVSEPGGGLEFPGQRTGLADLIFLPKNLSAMNPGARLPSNAFQKRPPPVPALDLGFKRRGGNHGRKIFWQKNGRVRLLTDRRVTHVSSRTSRDHQVLNETPTSGFSNPPFNPGRCPGLHRTDLPLPGLNFFERFFRSPIQRTANPPGGCPASRLRETA